MKMIFIEIKRWGDFDISITNSIWYKENPTDQEIEFKKQEILVEKMMEEFKNLSGEKFDLEKNSVYCSRKEWKILESFFDYLTARGYHIIESIKIQFTDEMLSKED